MSINAGITTEQEREAYELGVAAAKAAASWIIDGNTSQEHITRLLAMMDDGDPEAYDYLPARPDLSGEWADGPTPKSLFEDITGKDHAEAEQEAGMAYETLVGSAIDRLADAWERGVSETFEVECERLLREAIA